MSPLPLANKTIPNKSTISETYAQIAPYIHNTPILTSTQTNKYAHCELFFKCENFQKTGSFKLRGAINAILNLNEKEKKQGVLTHSSGNHGQAIAYAAKLFNIPASIIIPSNAVATKKQAILKYGASIITSEPSIQKREELTKKLVNETQATYIPPYDHPTIIAGQATLSVEFFKSQPSLDFLLVPVGGGGLLSGSLLTSYYFNPNCKVIGCEPDSANDAYLSFKSNVHHPALPTYTIADGLRTCLGKLNFQIIQQYAHDILTVTEDQIISALKWIWERLKLVIEPSAALPLATLFAYKNRFQNKKVGLILSGGNVDLNILSPLFAHD